MMFRLLVCLAIFGSLAFAVIPVGAAAAPELKKSCCAKMKMNAAVDDCAHHQAPKSDQEKQCCVGCSACLALFLTRATPFLYPPAGEESYATLSARALVRSYRPPVPPPRA